MILVDTIMMYADYVDKISFHSFYKDPNRLFGWGFLFSL